MKRPPEPTPTAFPTPQRAELAAAIVAAAGADARRAALQQATLAANRDVLAAISAVEAAEATLAAAGTNAVKHVVDKAMGAAGAPPMSIAQVRRAAIAAQDALEEARAVRAQLNSEQANFNSDLLTMRVDECAKAVIKSEMRERAVALAAKILQLQKDLIQQGSSLEWLHRFGVFPPIERGREDLVGHTVERLQVSPQQWALGGTVQWRVSFAIPTGANALAAAFEQLCKDAATLLPDV